MTIKLSSYGISDIGKVRENNEDVYAELPHLKFYALADGMGGHRAGEIAARETIAFLCEAIEHQFSLSQRARSIEEVKNDLRYSIEEVNRWIYALGQREESLRGMGTTLCFLLFYEESVIYSSVGDSRIYRFRKGALERLTKDHSLKDARFKSKNVLTKAIGTSSLLEPDILAFPLKSDDLYLMCSDGLTDFVSDEKIEKIFNNTLSLNSLADQCVKAAYQAGAGDNITILFIKAN